MKTYQLITLTDLRALWGFDVPFITPFPKATGMVLLRIKQDGTPYIGNSGGQICESLFEAMKDNKGRPFAIKAGLYTFSDIKQIAESALICNN